MVGDILKTRRKELNLTQQQVADKLHISRQTFSNWENEKSFPDIFMLIELSIFFELSLDYMIKGDEKLMKKIKEDATLNPLIQQSIFLFVVCLAASVWAILSLPRTGLVIENGLTVLSVDVLWQLTMIIAVLWMIFIYMRNFYALAENMLIKTIHKVIQAFLALSFIITICCFVMTILNYMGIIAFK
ncbi:helix-turn-helix domain-containing protein [Enterococcus sp. AZ109]|uniref:helix-turn-helix domain-containing protein n=1 Tax=Enterococcus sp. AZ109 TaxID=2774634 RepID=UPI003F22C78E